MGPNKSLFHTSLRGLNNHTMKYATKSGSLLWQIWLTSLIVSTLASLIAPANGELQLKSKSILCADAKCESLYGKGHTTIKYPSPDKDVLSFKKDVPVKIFGKTIDDQYMFVEINKNRGFVPAKHILEDAIINPSLTFTLDANQVQPNVSGEQPSDSSSAETPSLTTPSNLINDQPDSSFVYTSKSATVIEGTTFYEDITKTATPSPTYSSDSVTTKTATIEAHFTETELNQQNVGIDSSAADLSKVSDAVEQKEELDLNLNEEKKSNLSGEANSVPHVESPSSESVVNDSVTKEKTDETTEEKDEVKVEVVADDTLPENVEIIAPADPVPKDSASNGEPVHQNVDSAALPQTETSNDELKAPNASENIPKPETLSAFDHESEVNSDSVSSVQNDVPSQQGDDNNALPSAEEGENKQKLPVETENNVNSLTDDESKTEDKEKIEKDVLIEVPSVEVNEAEQAPSEVLSSDSEPSLQTKNADESVSNSDNSNVPSDNSNASLLNELPKENLVQQPQSGDSVVVAVETPAVSSNESPTKVESSQSDVANSLDKSVSSDESIVASNSNIEPNTKHNNEDLSASNTLSDQYLIPQASAEQLPPVVPLQQAEQQQQNVPNEPVPNIVSEQAQQQQAQMNPNLSHQSPDPSLNIALNQNVPPPPPSMHESLMNNPNLNQQPPQPGLSAFANTAAPPAEQPQPKQALPGSRFKLLRNARFAASAQNPEPPQPPVQPNPAHVDSNANFAHATPPPPSPPHHHAHQHPLPNAIPSPDALHPNQQHNQQFNSLPVSSGNIEPNQQQQPVQADVYDSGSIGGNLHADAKMIPTQNDQYDWNKQHTLDAAAPTNGVNSNNNISPPPPSESGHQSFPASDNLENYSTTENASHHRKLLAEKLFGGVIRDIIPDEIELFFESLGIPGHVFLFTSLVAFFWCSAKVVLSFWNSSRKERELRDLNCQIQRKIYFFEAEKDKLKEEATLAKEKLYTHERDLHLAEKKKSKLEIENEQMKNELQMLRNENGILRNKADETPHISSRLDSTLSDFEKAKIENRDLELKIEELEDDIVSYKETIKQNEKLGDSQSEKIKNQNEKIKELSTENDNLKDSLSDAEQSFSVVQSENQSLKSQLSKSNEEVRNIKDDLLSLQDKVDQLEAEKVTHLEFLEESKAKIKELVKETEEKKMEIESMRTLLNKLNKNITKESLKKQQRRQTLPNDLNGDITDATATTINGESNALSDSVESTSESTTVSTTKSDEEVDRDLQDIVQLQLKLTNIELEKSQVEIKLGSVQRQLEETTAKLDQVQTVNKQLKEETEQARHERTKAVTELEVLTRYYKEKELEYGKEIGVQRVKREQKEDDATSMASQLEVTLEENEVLKNKLKTTKKELEETERRLKSQLNALEKQSHENWIAARDASRKYEDSKAEATVLRQTLSFSVKSPPPVDLSMSGFLDDTASSISSLPDGLLNTSGLAVPPPPPPPPMMMMMGGIPPLPVPPIYGAPGDLTDANYWNASAAVASSAAQATSLPYPGSSSEPSSLVFVQAGQVPPYAQPPTSANVQQVSQQTSHQSAAPPPAQVNAYQQYPSVAPQPHYNHWEDLNRNTYSPALSQRSARSTSATPLTGVPLAMTSVATSVPAQSYNMSGQQQSVPQQQYHQQQQQYQQYGTTNSNNPSANASNPYSISNYQQQHQQSQQQQQQQQQYAQSYQHQQSSQQPVDPNSYGSQASHQIWTAGQPLPPNSELNAYSAFPQQHPQQQQQQHAQQNGPFGAVVDSASSRPASVHTQMV